jgi:hypothetical protein
MLKEVVLLRNSSSSYHACNSSRDQMGIPFSSLFLSHSPVVYLIVVGAANRPRTGSSSHALAAAQVFCFASFFAD